MKKYRDLPIGVKAALWYTVCNILQKAISVFIIPIYTRLLTPAEYGQYSVFISWLELFDIIVTLRLYGSAYSVGIVKYDDDKASFTSTLERLSLLITTGFLVLYLIFQAQVNAFTRLDTPLTLLMFLMLYAMPVVDFWKTWQRVENRYMSMVGATLLVAVLTPVLGICLILLVSRSAVSPISARVLSELIVAVIILAVSRKMFFGRIKTEYAKYALTFAIPLIPFYLSTMVLNHSDRIIISNLVGTDKAAIYSVAYSAAMVTLLFNTAFDSAMQPWLFRKLKEKKFDEIPSVTTISVVMIAVLNLVLIALAPEIVAVLAPPAYHEAIWIIPPLAVSVYVMFYYQRFIDIEFYYHESAMTSAASICAAILNIILNFLLIPKFGYLAAGYTTLISYVAFWCLQFAHHRKVFRRNGCPLSVVDNKALFGVTVLFFGISGMLMAGYEYAAIRYVFIALVVLSGLWQRKRIMGYAGRILKKH